MANLMRKAIAQHLGINATSVEAVTISKKFVILGLSQTSMDRVPSRKASNLSTSKETDSHLATTKDKGS